MDFLDFSGKTIMVAGASSGIGKETAVILSRYGAKLILVARREDRLQEVVSSLNGKGHSYYVTDLSATNEIEKLVKQIVADHGALDGLVYTAGISDSRPVQVAKPDFVEKMMRINFFGFYEMVRVVTQKKNYNPGMSIVGVSSCAAIHGSKSQSVYSATKGAMDSAVRIMAQEFGEKDIRINTVRPGMVNTEMYKRFLANMGEQSDTNLKNKQFLGIGEAEDVANAIAFLLSPLSKFTTGAHFSIDGGNTCH